MIQILFRLVCEQCDLQFGTNPEVARDQLALKKLDSLRSRAATAGWGRYRTVSTGSLGDYCPACVATRRAGREQRRAVSAITGKPRK